MVHAGVLRSHCVYKPVSGGGRCGDSPTERWPASAPYLVSTQLGWNLVPHTIIRDGPAGIGMLRSGLQQPGDAMNSDLCPGPTWPTTRPPARPGYLHRCCGPTFAGDEVVFDTRGRHRLRRMAGVRRAYQQRRPQGRSCGIDSPGLRSTIVVSARQNKLRTELWGWAGKPIDIKFCRRLPEARHLLRRRLPEWPSRSRNHRSYAPTRAIARWTNR